MSNRAPSAVVVDVRRATLPSTASRKSATMVIMTIAATGAGWTNASAISAATATTRVARVSVTQLAGPNVVARERASACVTAA